MGKLVILAFPCNQFGEQEPGSCSEIQDFAESKGVPCKDPDSGFLMMDKIEVNGPGTHEVYKFLKAATEDHSDVKWNFGSYWLVSAAGDIERLAGGMNNPSGFGSEHRVPGPTFSRLVGPA